MTKRLIGIKERMNKRPSYRLFNVNEFVFKITLQKVPS